MEPRSVSDSWENGNPYERYVGRWSRQVAPRFLDWLKVGAGRRWLDIGCGTGALCAAILDRCAPASVVGVEPSEGFVAAAVANLGGRADLKQGSATSIPLQDSSVDVVVSGLVLNFVPDLSAALAEMRRVSAADGTIAAYVWDYAGGMQLMRHFWDAAVDLDPAAAAYDEGLRFPICRPDALAQLFTEAGLSDVVVAAIDIATPFEDFGAYWQPFEGGQGPAPAYAMALGEEQRTRLREAIWERLPIEPDGSIRLTARAWAVRGLAPKLRGRSV
jgi:SAM-dependent methyltransferase